MISPLQIIFNQLTGQGNRYRLAGTLKGHSGAINTLTFNRDSSLLASGGNDEVVKIWDTKAFRNLETIRDLNGQWGQVTCAKFIITNPTTEVLCFGTGRGHFLVYRRPRKSGTLTEVSNSRAFPAGDGVESFAFDPIRHRLVLTSHHGMIKMYRFENGNLNEIWKEEIQDAIPRAVSFVDKGNNIMIYGLETGAAICRDSETATEKYIRTLKSSIGNVAISPSDGSILVDNMIDGFDIYSLPRTTPVRHFEVPTNKKYVKKAAFAEKGQTVVGGSDHGQVYVFAIDNSQAEQVLIHGKKDNMIQSVETATSCDHYIIGSGASSRPFNIQIWQKPIKEAPRQRRNFDLGFLILMNFAVILVAWTAHSWRPVIKAGVKAASNTVAEIVHDMHANLFASDKFQPLPPSPDPMEAILNLDEDLLRLLLGMPKVTEADLREEVEELD